MKIGSIGTFDTTRVKPFPGQPRKRFRGIKELSASIASVGQVIPGKVVPIKDPNFDVQLVDGERRLRACVIAGVQFRAEVCSAESEEGQFEASLAANFGRQDHDCIEVAHALKLLKDRGRSIQQIADICGGKTAAWVYQHLSLLNLHPDIQSMLVPSEKDEGERPLSFTVALMLANHDHEMQRKLARKIIGKGSDEARRIILKECGKAGVSAGARTRSPLELFTSLDRCIQQMTHKLGVFVDMSRETLAATIAAADIESRRDLVIYINELNDSLSGIADDLERSIAKQSTRKSAA